jgi:FtsP/CotA-like multicopper oxidase with cupredoxin domain
MSGTIIVEGLVDEVPEIAAARDLVLVFQELQLNDDGEVENPDITATSIPDVYPNDQTLLTVNDQLKPILRARPGEVVRLRCVNATIGTFYPLALDDHELYLIANDGITLCEVEPSDTVFIGPGNRADILIKAGAPGTYTLRGLEYARSPTLVRDEVDLMTFIVKDRRWIWVFPLFFRLRSRRLRKTKLQVRESLYLTR